MEVLFKAAYFLDVEQGDVRYTTLAGYVRMRTLVTPSGKTAKQIAFSAPDNALTARAGVCVVEEDSEEKLVLRRILDVSGKDSRWTLRPLTVEEWRQRGYTEYPEQVMAVPFLHWQTLEELAPFDPPDENDMLMDPQRVANPALYSE